MTQPFSYFGALCTLCSAICVSAGMPPPSLILVRIDCEDAMTLIG